MRARNSALLPALIVLMVRGLLLACGVTLFIAVASSGRMFDPDRRDSIGTHILGSHPYPEDPEAIMGEPLAFALRAEVKALITHKPQAVWQDGIITGRTLEERPRYDVRLADGSILWNLPASHLRVRTRRAARPADD